MNYKFFENMLMLLAGLWVLFVIITMLPLWLTLIILISAGLITYTEASTKDKETK